MPARRVGSAADRSPASRGDAAEPRTPAVESLEPRQREILKDIVHTYVVSGKPVSSRVVSRHAEHGLGAASIRNIMADLEELGLLRQPHTSAGRVPTEVAYRLYVQSLMHQRRVPREERRYIDEHLKEAAANLDRMMSAVSHLLSELSHQVGVVLTPAVEETVLKTIDFLPLGGRRVLCVVVSAGGFIDNLVIETEEPLEREELIRISNYLTENYAGRSMRQIRDRLLSLMAEERDQVDRWLRRAIELGQRAVGAPERRDVLVEGTVSLLEQPELADVERIRRMLDTFADKARLVKILNRCMVGDGVRVVMGDDSEVTSELDFSLVATSYGIGRQPLGSLGIIGPSRMEYPRIVPLVHYLGRTLSRALSLAREE